MVERRRLYPRLSIRLAATFRLGEGESLNEGMLKDLGPKGAGLLSPEEIQSGALVTDLRFELPDQPAIEVDSAVVVHSRRYRHQGKIVYLAGLQFVDFDAKTFERLRRFVVAHATPGDGGTR